MAVTAREEALRLLGLKDGATAEAIRRAFRLKALQYHPDKNLADPEGAAQQFQQLVRAYQRLANPTSDQAWEDLDPADILTDDFLNEALAQELPPFELMYMTLDDMSTWIKDCFMQQRMAACSSAADGPGGVPAGMRLWAEDLTGHATDKLWRKVHTAMQRRRQRRHTTGGTAQPGSKATSDTSDVTPWGLFWEFLTELLAHPQSGAQQQSNSSSQSGSVSRNLWRVPDSGSDEERCESVGDNEWSGDGEAARGLVCVSPSAKRRRKWQHVGKAEGAGSASEQAQSALHASGSSSSVESTEQKGLHSATHVGVVGAESSKHTRLACTAQEDSRLGGSQAGYDSDQLNDYDQQTRQPRWLTPGNAWVWTKRILFIKALLLLMKM